AEDAHPADPHRSGLVEPHWTPDAARVPGRIDQVRVLEHAGEAALGRQVGGLGAGDLDGEEVFGPLPQLISDLEAVREEVAFGVADVRAVEPDVALVEDAVEGKPAPPPCRRSSRFEAPAVQHRT